MSTRATYAFRDGECIATFYIHHDGYPSAAAQYFYNMRHYDGDHNERLCDRFFRANKGAQLTMSHEAHGDTEYRYTLSEDGMLIAQKCAHRSGDFPVDWEVIFSGDYYWFIKNHAGLQGGSN